MYRVSKDDRSRIADVVEMSRRFHEEAQEPGPFDKSRVAMFLSTVCNAGRAAMFVAIDENENPIGFLVAQCGQNYLTGELIAEETAVYVEPNCRRGIVGSTLIGLFEKWAIEDMGAKRLRVTAQSSLRADAVARLFAMRGYKEAERSFTKEVFY